MALIYSELVKAQFENLAGDPASNPTGLVYFNTGTGFPKWYDGSAWRTAVDTASTQSLAGKTFTTDTVFSSTGAITVPAGTTGQQPGAPTNGMLRYNSDNGAFEGYQSGAWAGIGGGGGGGGFLFNEPQGEAPTRSELAGERVYEYQASITQKLIGWAKVPSSYIPGAQVNMAVAFAVTSAGTDDVRMEAVATLIKSGTAVTSTTNQHTSTNADTTLSGTSNALNYLTLDLSDGSGEINSVAVAAGDLIKIELYREAPSGTEDTNDILLIPSATEVTFS